MSLLGTVAPAAFAQNTSVNTDDDFTFQSGAIGQGQLAANSANAGNAAGSGNIVAGNNAFGLSFQNQDADIDQDVDDNDDFNTAQVDICAIVLVGIVC
jgi:hypothetical protein